jgi:hypothetical protein
VLASDCPTQAPDTGNPSFPSVVGYPLPPPPQTMPGQDPGSPKRPSGLCAATSPPPFETGVATPGNPLGLPTPRTCKQPRRFAFLLHQPKQGRIVRADVYINGKRVKTIRAKSGGTVRSVVLTHLPAKPFALRVVATTDAHHKLVSKRTYHTCVKNHHHKKKHHSRDPDHDGDVDRAGQK